MADVILCAPVRPARIFGAGYNDASHAAETGKKMPRIPVLFMKPSTSVIGSGEPIVYPPQGQNVHYEGELAVIVGKRARGLSIDIALDAVFGYTCSDDVSDRTIQYEESSFGSLLIGKGMDTFCPLGPWISVGLDPANLNLTTHVNGKLRQRANTSQLAFSARDLLVYLSTYITLLPGDVILTGTFAGVGSMVPGDNVEIEIEGIGKLANPMQAA